MGSARRNDPCPCGSGRKFRHCCLRALDAEDTARIRLRTAEGVLVPALFGYAADKLGDEFFGEAWEEFFVVESSEPGRSINLEDILTGRGFHVLEQSASRTLRAGDVTFTRVVTARDASIMIGASPWIIPPAWHLRVIDFRE